MSATPNGPMAGQDGGTSGAGTNVPIGVWGDSGSGLGVWGTSNSFHGVHGWSSSSAGVYGESDNLHGVAGYSKSGGDGVHGATGGAGNGVYGRSDGGGFAGYFEGNATVTQNLSANNVSVGGNINKGGSCNFKIDHPLDPANKYLCHSAVESPDMKNIYDGVAVLDSAGESVVELPAWFEALNGDFRYQLTAVGGPGPNLYIKEKIRGRRFKIGGGQPGMEVSWQVTGIRHDLSANAHRCPVEEEKAESERGYYVHPELYGQPPEKNVRWAPHPAAVGPIKGRREPAGGGIPWAGPQSLRPDPGAGDLPAGE